MSDLTVMEAMVARELWNTADDYGHPEDYIEQARTLIHSLRPIVEAEVRERIAAEIESSHEDFADPLRRFCAVCCDDDHKSLPWPCPAVRIARGMS